MRATMRRQMNFSAKGQLGAISSYINPIVVIVDDDGNVELVAHRHEVV